MAKIKAFKTERFAAAQTSQRLSQLGAAIQDQHTKPGEQIYWSSRHDVWLRVRTVRGGYSIEYFMECPCNG